MFVAILISNLPEGIAATVGLKAGGWSLPARRHPVERDRPRQRAGGRARATRALDGASTDVLAFILAFAGGAVLDDAGHVDDAGGLRARRPVGGRAHRARLHPRLRDRLAPGLTPRRGR